MPKYRQLHIKVLDSDDFNEMPDEFTRLVWVLLPLILDREGRGYWNMAWLKSKLFPKREELDIATLKETFEWLRDKEMLIYYEVDGRKYFYVPTFKTYQKGTQYEAESLLPAPPDITSKLPEGLIKVGSEEPPATASASAYESVYESESVNEKPRFNQIRSHIEQITGLLPVPESIKAIDELVEMGAEDADITAGYQWRKDAGLPIKYYNQLIGPTRTAMSKRLGGNGNVKQPEKSVVDEVVEELFNGRR